MMQLGSREEEVHFELGVVVSETKNPPKAKANGAGKLTEALGVGMLTWHDHANCKGADADLFFPGAGGSTKKARALCAACEVKIECLDYSVDSGEKFGIWGGLSERERRRVRRKRAVKKHKLPKSA